MPPEEEEGLMKYTIFCVESHPALKIPMSDIRCVVNENMQRITGFRPFFIASRRVTVASKIKDREVNPRIKLHIS